MSNLAYFTLDQNGLTRIGRDIRNYEADKFEAGLAIGFGGNYDRVELPVEDHKSWSYDRKQVTVYVAKTCGAREDFLRLCNIAGQTPENYVYAVFYCERLVSIHKTYEGALQGLKVGHPLEVDPSITLIELAD